MIRQLTLAAIFSAGCVGWYQPPPAQDPAPNNNQNSNNNNSNNNNNAQPAAPDLADPPAPPDMAQPAPSPSPAPPSNAKPLFDANVAPIVIAQCSNAACHGGTGTSPIKFAAATLPNLYENVLLYSDKLLGGNFNKANAQMLSKIAAGHYTATYTPGNVTSIQQWLDAEVTARANTTPTVSPRVQLMAEWSGCMNLGEWNNQQVASAWANKGTSEGVCEVCHVNGQGWLASDDSQRVFDIITMRENPKGGMYMEFYFLPDLTTDPANPKMIINRAGLDRAAGGAAQHPRFTVDGNAYTRLTNFYNLTMTRKTNKTCDAPRFPGFGPAPSPSPGP